ncbi:hypothetical protein C2134_02830 [Chromobacterium sinusclupearum]|uniref:Uncharacterized protein n=1 Tax=Chromobacterium sinusclupearum TaxID=2077146 RepID=A0A2K4MT45_9NEIS|nr:hypothetical protein [Chromobacterium sinusclupearum]POB00143.1 hypothetical protein C2134_02830 [Chromobacterium sinusclupearum]
MQRALTQAATAIIRSRDAFLRSVVPPVMPATLAARQNRTRQRLNDRAERMHLRADTANGWD